MKIKLAKPIYLKSWVATCKVPPPRLSYAFHLFQLIIFVNAIPIIISVVVLFFFCSFRSNTNCDLPAFMQSPSSRTKMKQERLIQRRKKLKIEFCTNEGCKRLNNCVCMDVPLCRETKQLAEMRCF